MWSSWRAIDTSAFMEMLDMDEEENGRWDDLQSARSSLSGFDGGRGDTLIRLPTLVCLSCVGHHFKKGGCIKKLHMAIWTECSRAVFPR